MQKLKNRDLEQRNRDLTSSIMELEDKVQSFGEIVLIPAVIML
jgi:hypothetical protein